MCCRGFPTDVRRQGTGAETVPLHLPHVAVREGLVLGVKAPGLPGVHPVRSTKYITLQQYPTPHGDSRTLRPEKHKEAGSPANRGLLHSVIVAPTYRSPAPTSTYYKVRTIELAMRSMETNQSISFEGVFLLPQHGVRWKGTPG